MAAHIHSSSSTHINHSARSCHHNTDTQTDGTIQQHTQLQHSRHTAATTHPVDHHDTSFSHTSNRPTQLPQVLFITLLIRHSRPHILLVNYSPPHSLSSSTFVASIILPSNHSHTAPSLSPSLPSHSTAMARCLVSVLLLLCVLPLAVFGQFSTTQGSFNFYGAGNNQYAFSHCLDGSGSGSVFVTGSTDGTALGQSATGSGGYDWIIAKFDKNNGFLTKSANNPTLRFLYTAGADVGHSCVSDTSGAVYVAGVTTGTLGTGSTCTGSDRDTVVAKYDNNMNLLWTVQYDMAGSCRDDWAVKVMLFGSTLYVVGEVYPSTQTGIYYAYIQTLSTVDGSKLAAAPSYYGAAPNLYLGVRDASMDPNGNVVLVGGFYNGNLPSSLTVNGSVIPGYTLVGSVSGYVAGFNSLGSLRWQIGNGGGSYSQMLGVTTDVTGAVYASGFTEGNLRGVTYSGTGTLPLLQKLDVNGNVLWTVIYPNANYGGATRVVTDNIGGVYWLVADVSYYQCYGSYSNPILYLDSDYGNCGNPYLNIYKTDVNGAVQYTGGFSTGIAQSFTIDNTGLLTVAGDIYQSYALHGLTATTAGLNGFIDQQSINYNCSCSNLASLVTQMSQLLNISTS